MRPCRSPFVMTARSGHGSAFTGRGDGWQCRCGALINGVIMSGSRLAVRNSGRAALSPEWSIPPVPSCMSNMVGLSRVCRYWRSGRALCAGLCTPAGIACGIWGTACAGTHIPSAMCDDVPMCRGQSAEAGSGFAARISVSVRKRRFAVAVHGSPVQRFPQRCAAQPPPRHHRTTATCATTVPTAPARATGTPPACRRHAGSRRFCKDPVFG